MKPEIIAKYQVTLERRPHSSTNYQRLRTARFGFFSLSMRTRLSEPDSLQGPAIDNLANKYDGGGHPMACGANLGTWEKVDELLDDADKLVKEYKEQLLANQS